MSSPSEPQHPNAGGPPTGRHRLGPHVVGERVVVRRLLRGERGPSGGPAFGDVLGVCMSWGETTCVLETRTGERTEVPLADIVSGKPVPRRPSVRRRVSPRDAEQHTAALFEDVETVPVGAWTIRWQADVRGRPRKRANSCLAMGDPGLPIADALSEVARFYRARDRGPLVQVEAGSEVEAAVADAGWRPLDGGEAAHMLTSVAMLQRELRTGDDRVRLEGDGPRVRACVGDGGDERARGAAALDGDWLGLHDVHVDPEHRRRGLAREVVAALVEWGAEQGARTVWLHVETDNAPAWGLYDSLGFGEHHRCRYYAAGGPEAPA